MSEHGNTLTHILLELIEKAANGSFSERVEAMTEARAQIEQLFNGFSG